MADGVPPPHEPPLAPEAPELLERFIYYLTHEFVPFGAVDYALQRAHAETAPLPAGPMRDYAMRTARELVYRPTPVSE